jgi:hypothetical protein
MGRPYHGFASGTRSGVQAEISLGAWFEDDIEIWTDQPIGAL